MVLATLIILLIGLSGVVLLAIGLRGRAIDDHPVCRKCGYDLTGIFPESKKCPECEADVSADRNVRIGNRVRSRFLIGTAAVLLLFSIVAGGQKTWRWATDSYLSATIKEQREVNIRTLLYASLAYARDNGNQLPNELWALKGPYLKGRLRYLAPPGSMTKIQRRDDMNQKDTYILRPGLKADDLSETIVIGEPYDPRLDGAHFVLLNGWVLFKRGDEAKNAYEELRRARGDYAKTQALDQTPD